ncbi:2-hydroxy-6-oxononadienedioate/2-hydroxy-6-oxononatrienedioate hydrolase-like protein [Hapsidospora chrysogenum ATCC 11550]|uniref:2-hydroxy-6-oxononadienedioate/2-hydroxy-6-oxononatrienedioate hydrolase-like protein n=1 Tax=Hapsidospora chrysogenum (strain ATCC 11550 / CBS 779.69 / DSM 880 / IAM 14645 / JCM 23072 / IMI 49137) TaxID=857340 RepID=A0A086SZE6_HAPC1|nr:2-hydroxy-6-oxononadienedioate/2-hydroxy-6-oxononatrienedioate hydrolase-like protein [Hapsidospora chrysogenum ATCC 11550]
MDPLATGHVLINNTRVAQGVHGQGEPLVLIHGTPSSSLIWRNVLPKLVAAGFKIHVFDLLGYGLSERPWDPTVDTSISGQVPILEGLLKHWNLDRVHIVAHDIGGAVAQRFAVFSPRRVKTLTLIDVVSFDSYPSKRTREQMEKGLESLVKAPSDDHKAHFKEWLLSAVHNKDKFTSSSLDTFLGYISGDVGQGSLFQHQIRHYDPKHTMEIADRLPELGKLPVKLIWGGQDIWQVPDWAHRLHKTIPGSELNILEECGHFSPEDQPEEISELVLDFIARSQG